MTIESKQLAGIFKQIDEQFSSHKIISVTPVKGNPPDHYEIIYTIPGMTLVNGEKIQGTHHIIEFSIPFGFPHFPPRCKPKSDIFHPDFDPAAICLGDFWGENQSLPELIIHIGRMISGEFYSSDNAFNTQAAIWYAKHQEKIPFSTLLAPAATKDENVDDMIEIDTLDDFDFTTDDDYLSFDDLQEHDENSSPAGASPAGQASLEINISLLQLLDKQKKYIKLLETIKGLPSSTKEVELFSSDAQKAVNKAERYNKISQQNEQEGKSGLALEGYEKIASLVADFPDISAKISRVKKNLDLHNVIPPKTVAHPESQTIPINKPDNLNFSQKQKNHIAGDSSTGPVSVPARPLHKRAGFKLFILLFISIHAGGVGIYFYVEAQKEKLALAVHSYDQCLAQLKINSFISAKNNCEIALQLGRKVEYLQQQGSTGLTSKIRAILQSEKLQQGLKGKLLIEGQYLTKAEAKTAFQFKKLGAEGTDLFEQSQWKSAIEKLQQAIDIAYSNSFIDAAVLPDFTSKLQHARFQIFLQSATDKLNQKAWKKAMISSTDALAYLNKLPPKVQQQYRTQLQQNIATSEFEDMKIEADRLFAESDWQNATSHYRRLLTLAKSNENISQETLTEVSTNIVRAKLYSTINSGNRAYSSGFWDEAILAYQNGQSLLADNRGLLTLTDSDATIRKLDKIILQTTVIKYRQAAKNFLEGDNLPAAKTSHENIIQQIKTSSFASSSDYQKITAESSETIQSLGQEIFLNESRLYLETSYQKFFTTNFPAVSPEDLSHPVATLEKKTTEKFLFKLQCTETNSAQRLFLILYYAYDKKSGTWELFSGTP